MYSLPLDNEDAVLPPVEEVDEENLDKQIEKFQSDFHGVTPIAEVEMDRSTVGEDFE